MITNKKIKELGQLRHSISRIPDKITVLPECTEIHKFMELIPRRKAELLSDIKLLEKYYEQENRSR